MFKWPTLGPLPAPTNNPWHSKEPLFSPQPPHLPRKRAVPMFQWLTTMSLLTPNDNPLASVSLSSPNSPPPTQTHTS